MMIFKKTISFMRSRLMQTVLVVFCVALYLNTIPNHFSMDDELVTNNNKRIEGGIKSIPGIWMTRYSEGKLKYEYRPVVKTTFAIEYQFFNGNPHVSHLVNILLYALTCLLLLKVLRKLFPAFHPLFHFITVMLFAAHPVHTEVVASLKNRDEMLSFLGCLATLYYFLRFADTSKARFVLYAFISYLLAYLSKSSAIVFFAVIPLALYFYGKTPVKKIVLVTVLVFVTAMAARYLPRTYLPRPERDVFFFENPLFFIRNLYLVLGTSLITLLFYLKLMIVPHPLLFYYGYNMIPVAGVLNPWALASLVVHLALFVVALLLLRKKHIVSFAILYYLFCLSLFSNIPAPAMGIVAERFAFAASLGFCLLLAFLILKISSADLYAGPSGKMSLNKVWIVSAIILMLYSVKTISRNPDWDTHMSLYRHDIRYLERSAKANTIIAWQMLADINKSLDKGIIPERLTEKADSILFFFRRSVAVFPQYYSSYNNIGTVYFTILAGLEPDSVKKLRYYQTSVSYFEKALEIKPDYADASYNLAFAYERTGKYRDAIRYYMKTLHDKPDNIKAMSNMANIYNDRINKFDSAVMINKMIMDTDPASDLPYVNMGSYYIMQNKMDVAVLYLDTALQKSPQNYQLASFLENYYRNRNIEMAERYRKISAHAQELLEAQNENRE